MKEKRKIRGNILKILIFSIVTVCIITFICGVNKSYANSGFDTAFKQSFEVSDDSQGVDQDYIRRRAIILITLTLLPFVIFIIAVIMFICEKIHIKKKITDENEKKKRNKKAIIKFIILIVIAFIISIIGDNMKSFTIKKPLIYLYPETEEIVEVSLLKEENLTCTYPKYKDKWSVIAKPNGELINLENKRNLYGLYWEGKNTIHYDTTYGFCVEGNKTVEFLEEKLATLGLTEREANELIIYWLPRLEKNKYNYIRFATEKEINEEMPLEINPKPDSIIRVWMVYKRLNRKIDVEEQELKIPERNGFVAVEWGGIEL